MKSEVGVNDDEGPPVPIPNTEVKLVRANNTWLETAREDRSTPTRLKEQNPDEYVRVLFIFLSVYVLYREWIGVQRVAEDVAPYS